MEIETPVKISDTIKQGLMAEPKANGVFIENSSILTLDPDELENPDDPEDETGNGIREETNDLFYDDETARFLAVVSDAFPLRKLFEFLKGFHGKGNLRCSKDRILFEEVSTIGGSPNSVFNQLEIETCEFTEYDFAARDPEILVGIHLGDIYGIMRTIRKRDGVKIFKRPGDNSLYIQIIKHDVPISHQGGNVSVIRPQAVDRCRLNRPTYQNSERNPNFTITSTTFTKICTDISSVRGVEKITIHSYRRWVLLKAMRSGGIAGRAERMGNFDDQIRPVSPTEYQPTDLISNPQGGRPRLVLRNSPQTEEFFLTVRRDTIKALSKLNHLSPSSSIKVYLEKGLPFKLVTKVGSYGVLRVYIRSIET
jgi:hypothetical protein